MEDAEEGDGDAGTYEGRFGGDVPAAEDDAGSFDLGVPTDEYRSYYEYDDDDI